MKLKHLGFVFVGLFLVAGLLFSTGCERKKAGEVQSVSAVRGAGQCSLPGNAFPERLQIRVDGSNGMPLAGQKVRFVPQSGSDLRVSPAEAVSDAGGIVMVSVSAGNQVGDLYLNVIPESNPAKAMAVRFISGV